MTDAARARFWAKVKKSDGCWLWTGGIGQNGYGLFWLDGKIVLAHRVAFYVEHGRWPDPCGLHACDTRACVRVGPRHIFEGTKADNSADMKAKGRGRGPNNDKTHCKRGHEFTGANTGRKTGKVSGRYCRECYREQHRRWLKRNVVAR